MVCSICGTDQETVSHVLFTCDRARRVSEYGYYPRLVFGLNLSEKAHLKGKEKWCALGLFARLATICWHIWIARNEWIFLQKKEISSSRETHNLCMTRMLQRKTSSFHLGSSFNSCLFNFVSRDRIGWLMF